MVNERVTFTFHLRPQLVVAALVAAVQQRQSIAQWLERAIATNLAQAGHAGEEGDELVALFCDVAERDPERLPPRLRRTYDAMCRNWERYWFVPRVTVEQLEHAAVPDAAMPQLNRERVAADLRDLFQREA